MEKGKFERKIVNIIERTRTIIQYILKKFKEDKIIINKPCEEKPKLLTIVMMYIDNENRIFISRHLKYVKRYYLH